MVLGEGQILSQVKDAHQAALEARTAGPLVDQLFKLAITCGKRVRTETSMGRRAVSVSSAAVELGRSILGPLGNRTTLVVGAGRMAKVSLKLLLNENGTGPVLLVNRGHERISQLLDNDLPNRDRLKTGFGLEEIHELAAASDLVIISTSAPDYLLTYEAMSKLPRDKELCVIDISVPRNADPKLAELPGVRVFHADDLSAIVNKNLAEREALVSEAEQIIFESLDGFHGWQRSLLVVPTITELRQKIESIRIAHMEKTQVVGDAELQASTKSQLEDISRAIVNQILHHPTVQLKATTDYQALRQKAEALRTLFNLDSLTPLASQPNTNQPSASGCPFSGGTGQAAPDKLTQIDQALQDFASRLKESLIEL
jgi:glutamyl-tRNA reductase